MIRALALFAILLFAALPARAEPPPEITDFLASYRAAWNAHEIEKLDRFWDTKERAPVYLAEEARSAAMEWPDIRAYWKDAAKSIERIEVNYSNVRTTPPVDGTVTVVMDMRWDAKWDGGQFTGGDNRVVARLRQTPQGWRLISWVEAPLAPIVYLRQLYRQSVPEETRARLNTPR
jgi:SnoaL-like domain